MLAIIINNQKYKCDCGSNNIVQNNELIKCLDCGSLKNIEDASSNQSKEPCISINVPRIICEFPDAYSKETNCEKCPLK